MNCAFGIRKLNCVCRQQGLCHNSTYFPCAKIVPQYDFDVNIICVIDINCHRKYVDDLITKIDVKQTFELLSMESWCRGITTLRAPDAISPRQCPTKNGLIPPSSRSKEVIVRTHFYAPSFRGFRLDIASPPIANRST